MIKYFKYKGLKKFYETGNKQGIRAQHSTKLRMQLAALDSALLIEDLDIPGYGFISLRGTGKEHGQFL